MHFIDIGINLTDNMFRGKYRGKRLHQDDFDLILERAQRAGVERMIITGTDLIESRKAAAMTDKKEHAGFLYSTVGCHPTRCGEFKKYKHGPQAYLDALRAVIKKSPNVVAIGECGLDYDRLHFCDAQTQKEYFAAQFALAKETQLPMFLHDRNTGDDFYNMVKHHRNDFTHGVVHSFTGSMEQMERLLELGLYIGINGCSLKTAANLEVVKAIPQDRIMIETDGPWCEMRPSHASFEFLASIPVDEMAMYYPKSKRKDRFEMGCTVKSRCEPCTTGSVLYVVASVRNEDPQILSEIIWSNTCRMFFTQ